MILYLSVGAGILLAVLLCLFGKCYECIKARCQPVSPPKERVQQPEEGSELTDDDEMRSKYVDSIVANQKTGAKEQRESEHEHDRSIDRKDTDSQLQVVAESSRAERQKTCVMDRLARLDKKIEEMQP